jgi:hypothetical protein
MASFFFVVIVSPSSVMWKNTNPTQSFGLHETVTHYDALAELVSSANC